MAQSKDLLRFRARLKSRGYTDIKIKRHIEPSGEMSFDQFGYPLWYVTCNEPLLGFMACFVVSEPQMNNWPGISFDNCGYFALQTSLFDEDNIVNEIFEGGDGIFV